MVDAAPVAGRRPERFEREPGFAEKALGVVRRRAVSPGLLGVQLDVGGLHVVERVAESPENVQFRPLHVDLDDVGDRHAVRDQRRGAPALDARAAHLRQVVVTGAGGAMLLGEIERETFRSTVFVPEGERRDTPLAVGVVRPQVRAEPVAVLVVRFEPDDGPVRDDVGDETAVDPDVRADVPETVSGAVSESNRSSIARSPWRDFARLYSNHVVVASTAAASPTVVRYL